jgi:hypothetical protein
MSNGSEWANALVKGITTPYNTAKLLEEWYVPSFNRGPGSLDASLGRGR